MNKVGRETIREVLMNFHDKPINFKEKFKLVSELWSPKVIAQMNDYHFKIAKIKGEFVWHSHPNTDETFIVISGNMRIEFREGSTDLCSGEMIIVPKGIDHKPIADDECHILMIELEGTVNTGDSVSDLTVEQVEWI
jgi:mannose-6-phosphate isomerase-like protein (cupin superfamily)